MFDDCDGLVFDIRVLSVRLCFVIWMCYINRKRNKLSHYLIEQLIRLCELILISVLD